MRTRSWKQRHGEDLDKNQECPVWIRLLLPAVLFSAGRECSLGIMCTLPKSRLLLLVQDTCLPDGRPIPSKYSGYFSQYLLTQSWSVAYHKHAGLQHIFLKIVPLITLKYLCRRLPAPALGRLSRSWGESPSFTTSWGQTPCHGLPHGGCLFFNAALASFSSS